MSCCARSSLHEFLCFFGHTSSHMAQIRCMGRTWSIFRYFSHFYRVVFIGVHCTSLFDFFRCARLHEAQIRWLGGAWTNFVFLSNFWRGFLIGRR